MGASLRRTVALVAGLVALLSMGTALAAGSANKLVQEAEIWHWQNCSEPRLQIFASDESRALQHVLGRAEKATQDPRLLYWQGLLASCTGQAEQGQKQLKLFLAMAQGAYPRLEARASYDLAFRQNDCAGVIAATEQLIALDAVPMQDYLRHFSALQCQAPCGAPEEMLSTAQEVLASAPTAALALELMLDASLCSNSCVAIVANYRKLEAAGGDIGSYKAKFDECAPQVASFTLPECRDEMQVGVRDQDGELQQLSWGEEVLIEAGGDLEFALPGQRPSGLGGAPRLVQPLSSLPAQSIVTPPSVVVLDGGNSSPFTLSFPSEQGPVRKSVSIHRAAGPRRLLAPVTVGADVELAIDVPGLGVAKGRLPLRSCQAHRLTLDFTSLPGTAALVEQRRSARSLAAPVAVTSAGLGAGASFVAVGLSAIPGLAGISDAADVARTLQEYEQVTAGRADLETRLALGVSVGSALVAGGVAALVEVIKKSAALRAARAKHLSRVAEPAELSQIASVELVPEHKATTDPAAHGGTSASSGADGKQVASNKEADPEVEVSSRPSSDRRAPTRGQAAKKASEAEASAAVPQVPKEPVSGGSIRATQVEAAQGEFRAVLTADLTGHADSLQAHYRLAGAAWQSQQMIMKDIVAPAEGPVLKEEWTAVLRTKASDGARSELEYYVVVLSRGQEFAIGTRRSPKKLVLQVPSSP